MQTSTNINQGTPKGEMRLIATDSNHMALPNPINKPAVTPDTMQMAPSHLPVMPLSSSMPSMSMLLPRDTMKASTPQAMAAVDASANCTRHAMLPNGTSAVQ